ncbi:hypothetical protein [Paenibacillus sp. NPDC058071]|uniref:hypothetical protein n=1 Tax=Paenibacillus sp. NPDC058071 TaxID=3346326 RepID=UPI0036DDE184
MKETILEEMRKFEHDDDRRYQLLLRYLRIVNAENKQRGFFKKLKRKWWGRMKKS